MAGCSFATAAQPEAPLALEWFENAHCVWSSANDDQMTALPSLLTAFNSFSRPES
jgi:hypothetical protein